MLSSWIRGSKTPWQAQRYIKGDQRYSELMLPLLITIDTEYSAGLYQHGIGRDRAANFARAIACRSAAGEAGIFYQLDTFARHGIKAVFFVDPMPALVWGQEAVDAVVQPILAAGHEVQLHCHTEWLAFAAQSPLPGQEGNNIKDFSRVEQRALLEWGLERIEAAGAPRPTAFRAGNYGANDDTLRALAELGLRWDSSFAPGYAGSPCEISLPMGDCRPVGHLGVMEFPCSAIAAAGGCRHAQLTALSFTEIRSAILHAARTGWPGFCLVSHSFEMYNRATQRPNALLCNRFEKLCAWLGQQGEVVSAGFADLPEVSSTAAVPLLPHSRWRTGARMAQQLAANTVYR